MISKIKQYSALLTLVAGFSLSTQVSAQTGESAKFDAYNTYKYLKEKGTGRCIGNVSGCEDGTGPSVTQFKQINGFSSSQYGQATRYTKFGNIDGDPNNVIDPVAKYSSPLGLGSQKHAPVAIERPASKNSNSNFIYFTYSGPVTLDNSTTIASTSGQGNLSTTQEFHFDTKKSPVLGIYVSKYNPTTNQATKPILVHAKYTDDFHDNAVINMDRDGHIYVLISGRSNGRQMLLYRSNAPYSLSGFTDITPDTPSAAHKVSYPKFFWTDNGYFRLVYTDYDSRGDRNIWSAEIVPNGSQKALLRQAEPIAELGGHYVVGDARGNDIVIAFNEHFGHPDSRTNLYYMHSEDGGETWKNANDQNLSIPLTRSALNSVAVKQYNISSTDQLIYVKDIAFETTSNGRKYPEIAVIGVQGAKGSPLHEPSINTNTHDRYLSTWIRNQDNTQWLGRRFTENVDHNYSTAALHQSSSTAVIYAQTLKGQGNYLAGGSLAKGGLTVTQHQGGVLANSVENGRLFSDPSYCTFNNIRPIHTTTEDGSNHIWAVATAGHPQRYTPHNPLVFVLSNGEVRQLPRTSSTSSEWLDTVRITQCGY